MTAKNNIVPIKPVAGNDWQDPFSIDDIPEPTPPSVRLQTATKGILDTIMQALPGVENIPDTGMGDLSELARLSGRSVDELIDLVASSDPRRPLDTHEKGFGCTVEYPLQAPAHFAYSRFKIDEEGKAAAFLIVARKGGLSTAWFMCQVPMGAHLKARDVLEQGEDAWLRFAPQIEACMVGAYPDEDSAVHALRVKSLPIPAVTEDLLSAALVNFRVAEASLVNAVVLVRFASLSLHGSTADILAGFIKELPNATTQSAHPLPAGHSRNDAPPLGCDSAGPGSAVDTRIQTSRSAGLEQPAEDTPTDRIDFNRKVPNPKSHPGGDIRRAPIYKP